MKKPLRPLDPSEISYLLESRIRKEIRTDSILNPASPVDLRAEFSVDILPALEPSIIGPLVR